MRVVIIGGGWAGTAAAISARKAGAEVCLLEKTDMLLGVGNAGGIMRNNGRFTAAEEMIALGGGELFQLIDRIALHMMNDVAKRIRERGIELEVTSEAAQVAAKAGYDLQYGARPLRRAIQRLVEDALSEEILSGNIKLGQRVRMLPDGDKLRFVHTEV